MKDEHCIPQHKRMAMGQRVGLKSGGSVGGDNTSRSLKTGIPDSPVESARRANGIPGMKKGGKV